jgi:hypothetical protein
VRSSEVTTAPAGEPATTSSEPSEPNGGPRRRERRASRRGECQIEISEVAPNRVASGETSTVVGSLTCGVSGASEQSVAIYQHTAGTRGYGLAGTATSEASGAFRFTSGPLEADSSFYASSGGARSQRAAVRVAPLVTIGALPMTTQVPSASARRRARASVSTAVTFTGTVTPAQPGARVVLQGERVAGSGHWRRLGVGEVGADGSYSITYAFASAGAVNVRAVVHARGFAASASEPISYDVAGAQEVRGARRAHSVTPSEGVRPALSAQVSASAVGIGETLTFSGTIVPESTGRPVYLERQVHGGIGFQVVKVGVVSAGSTFTLEESPLAVGTQVFRVKLPGGAGEQALVSQPFEIQVTSAIADELNAPPPGETPAA